MHTLTQKSFIATSSSCTLAEDKENSSVGTGCNLGLVARCEQTSVNNLAVKFSVSVCLVESNPFLGQDRACSIEKDDPQAQCAGA